MYKTEYMRRKTNWQKEQDDTSKIVRDYLAMAEDWPDIHPNIVEGAKDMIAEDIIIFERYEEYEKCARLKKAFEQLGKFK
tara:strand:+ start:737 stop:976 length:240 start_codon:yes stop_codon:yes gene_type:complete